MKSTSPLPIGSKYGKYPSFGQKCLGQFFLVYVLVAYLLFIGPPVTFADDCSQAKLTGEGQVTSISGPADEVAALAAQGVVLGADVSFFIIIDPKRFAPTGGGVPAFGGKEAVQAFSASMGGFSLDGPATVGCDEFFSPPSNPTCSDVGGASGGGQTDISIGTTVIQNALSAVAVNLSFAGLWSQDELEHFFNFPGAFTDRTIQFETDSGLKVTANITTYNSVCTSTSGINTTAANFKQSGSIGRVNTFTCELVLPIRRVLDLGGPLPLAFSLYYASGLNKTGPMGRNWSHTFNWSLSINGTEVTIVDPEGRTITFQEDGAGFQLIGPTDIPYKITKIGTDFILLDPRTHILYTFDNSGFLTKIDDGKGNMLTLSYVGGQLDQVTDNLGRTLDFTYDGSGRLISVTDGTRTVTFGYSDFLLTSITDGRGKTTVFNYDSGAIPGLITKITRAEGNTPITMTYDADGKVINFTTGTGNVWTLAYDPATNTKTITDPEGNIWRYTHTQEGELITFEDATGLERTITYNANGQPNGLTDRLGETTSVTYHSPSGKPASITFADGNIITFEYTARVMTGGHTCYDLTLITFPDGTTISIEYDANGNPIKYTDQSGKMWAFTYNGNGQVLTITNPLGGVVSFTYNPDGTLASWTDPAGNTTTYDYDGLRRPIYYADTDGNAREQTIDSNNNLLTRTNENGNVTTFIYDGNNNLIEIVGAGGHSRILAHNNQDKISKYTDPSGNTIDYAYNVMDLPNSITDQSGNTTEYFRDLLGNINKITDAAGNSQKIKYNAEGVPTAVTDRNGNTTKI
jgi:YD repeat-containing protein